MMSKENKNIMVNGELSMVNEKDNSQFTTHNSQFKKTEVGVIPEDWKLEKLHNIGKFFKGRNIPRAELRTEGVSCVLYGEIYTKYNFVAYLLNSKTSFKIAKESFEIKKGDLLFAGSGETAEDIGKCFAYLGDEFSVAGGDIIVLRPQNIFNSCFLGYALNTSNSANQKYYMGQGSSVYHIYSSSLKNLKIPLPPTRTEQTAIATALSDMDALIEKLEQLIAKKRNIKQGAMQELLKPKEGWEVRKLGEIAEIKKGQLITSTTKISGNIPVIAGGKAPAYYHKYANRKGRTITISGSGANAGFVSFHNYPIFASDCSTISESKNYTIEFIFFCLINIQDKIYKSQTGGAQPHIHPSDLSPLEIQFPPIQEQTRIAQILSDMDSEIEKSETQLSKYKMIKTGMMQELLTGKKRLI